MLLPSYKSYSYHPRMLEIKIFDKSLRQYSFIISFISSDDIGAQQNMRKAPK